MHVLDVQDCPGRISRPAGLNLVSESHKKTIIINVTHLFGLTGTIVVKVIANHLIVDLFIVISIVNKI